MNIGKKILFESLSFLFVLCVFTYFSSRAGLPFVVVLSISVLSFFIVVFPHFVLFIDGFGRTFKTNFKGLKINVEYKVIKKEKSSAEIEINKERKIFVKDFEKYAPFVNEGDYFVIQSFSPLDITWIVRENASENIDIHI